MDVLTNENSLPKILYVSFVFIMNLSVVLIVCSFTVFHFNQLVGKGRTTIEFCEGSRKDDYNVGFCKNMAITFGSNPLLWFWPGFTNTEGSGVNFKHNEKGLEQDSDQDGLMESAEEVERIDTSQT